MYLKSKNFARGIVDPSLGLLVMLLLLGNVLLVGQDFIQPRDAFADKVPFPPNPAPNFGSVYHRVFWCDLWCICPSSGGVICSCSVKNT